MTRYRPWRIAHLRLDAAVQEMAPEESCDGVYAVFWWQDVPLGLARISARELPLSAGQLIDLGLATIAPAVARRVGGAGGPVFMLDAPLSRLRDLVEVPCAAVAELSASIVVCTRDRPDMLARCLQSLTPTLGRGDEIVVVDNAPSNDATRTLVQNRNGTRYVRELRPGLDVARNRGVRESGGTLVVFCDDDVVVEPSWLRRLKAAFLDPTVAAVTGLVLPAALETEAQYVFETYWGFNRGFLLRTFGPEYFARHRSSGVPVWEIGAGASMAFRRDVLAQVGEFDERLDAGAAGCSGDSEMWYRILAAGHTCLYEPTAVAYHQHRREMPQLERQIFNYMRGHAAALLIQFERHGHWGNLRRLLLALPLYYAGRLARHAVGIDRRRTQTLTREIAGWLAGIGFYFRQRSSGVSR